jgi:hypothetical protein
MTHVVDQASSDRVIIRNFQPRKPRNKRNYLRVFGVFRGCFNELLPYPEFFVRHSLSYANATSRFVGLGEFDVSPILC